MAAMSLPVLAARKAGDPEPDLTPLLVRHRAIRADVARLAALLAGLGDQRPRPGQARALCGYTSAVVAALRRHERDEDEIIWPLIAATARQAVDLAPFSDDHKAIDALSGQVTRLLPGLPAGPAGCAATVGALASELALLLDEHIAEEEAQLLPAMRRYLPAEACRWCERRIARRTPVADLRFSVPWLVRHARGDETRRLLAAGGWRFRVVLAVSRQRYDRLERGTFGARGAGLTAPELTERGTQTMDQLHVAAEQTARTTPEVVWALISDATRYPQWGPWSAGGYRQAGDTSPRGPGAVQWLRSSRRAYLRYTTSIERILEAEEPRRLVYTVIGGIPVRNYRAEVTLTPAGDGTRVRWAATWDATLAGRLVLRGLRTFYPQMMADLVAAAERQNAP